MESKKNKLTFLEEFAKAKEGMLVMLDAYLYNARSGYHGMPAPILDYSTSLVMEMVTHTKAECGNSQNIEDIVVKEGLVNLAAKGVKIMEVMHNDKNAVNSIFTCKKEHCVTKGLVAENQEVHGKDKGPTREGKEERVSSTINHNINISKTWTNEILKNFMQVHMMKPDRHQG